MSSGLGLLTTDARLAIQSWNRWLEAASGLSETDVLGRPLLDLVPDAARDSMSEVFADVLQNGTTRVLSSALHHHLIRCAPRLPSSCFAHMQQLVTVTSVRDGESIAGLLVTIEDVTLQWERDRARAQQLSGNPGTSDSRLLQEVGAADWRRRAEAIRALSQTAGEEEIDELLQALEKQHLDLNVLSGVLQTLVTSRRDVLAPLAALLDNQSSNIRMHAAQALGLLNDRRAVAPLVKALDDSDTNVRFHALEALGRLRAPDAIDPLVRLAQCGDFFLAFPAVDALASIDDPYVVPELIELLQQEMLRPAVVDALRAIGDEECVAPLLRGLDEETLEASAVAAALSAIHDRYEESDAAGPHIRDRILSALTDRASRRLIAAAATRQDPRAPLVRLLGWIGGDAVDVLAEAIGEPSIQNEVSEALVNCGAAAVDPVIAKVGASTRDARLAAASLLGRLADRRATVALIDAMRQGDADLTTAAAGSLAVVGDERALEPLMELFGDPQAPVRRAAIAAVNSIGARATEERLLALFADANPHVRECAVRVAGYFGYERSAALIRRAVHDPSEIVRRAALEQLPFMSDRQGGALLLESLHGGSPRSRATAAHALKLAEDVDAETALITALGDADAWVRYFAADSLAVHGGAAALDALAGLAEHDAAIQVRIAALRALGALSTGAGAVVARRLLANDDSDLACAAMAVFAASTDQDVDEQLQQAVSGGQPLLRAAAIEALGSRRTERAVAVLLGAARLPLAPALGPAAIVALGRVAAASDAVAGRSAINALLELGSALEWRSDALSALASLPPHVIPWLQGDHTAPASARRVAVETLARMRHPEASSLILAALSDGDASVRAAAVGAVGRLASLAAAEAVAELAARDPDPAVRRRAAMVCRRHGWHRGSGIGTR